MFSTLVLASVVALSQARPYTDEAITDAESGWMTPWMMAAAAGVVLVMTTLACTCCRRPKGGFAEFRGSAQLSEMAPQAGELTLFPPPSLSLSREDVDVSFEALPEPTIPVRPAIHSYHSKEIGEWMEAGQGIFPRSNIQYLREIGRGWFGQVVEAEVNDPDNPQGVTRCVVKILRPEADAEEHIRFLNSVRPLLQLEQHQNVVQLLGCCLETAPLLVLMQHCTNGDLKQFLLSYGGAMQRQINRARQMPPLPENVLLRMAYEASEGLRHWHRNGFIHPDVAARSFLVTGDMSILIGDYGTHSLTYKDEFFNPDAEKPIPLRWISPESLSATLQWTPTAPGNVWSFGVVLWEILSLGCRPYAALNDENVILQVLREKRTVLNPPDLSYQQGQTLYRLMVHCWEVDPQLRPSIDEIGSRLAAAVAGVNRDVERDLEKAFDSRWNAAKPNNSGNPEPKSGSESPSASLNNLHGSLDDVSSASRRESTTLNDLSAHTDKESDSTFSAKVSAALRSLDEALAAAGGNLEDTLPEPQFRLDPEGNTGSAEVLDATDEDSSSGSSSLFSSRSWQDKVTRGDLTALVREKSRSVQDLMVLTHVEPLSDVEFVARGLRERSEQTAVTPEVPEASGSGQSDQLDPAVPADPMTLAAPAPIPQIAVTSPSYTARSPHGESSIPLLDSTDANKGDLLDAGSFINRNRNRLTSTPREDTNLSAMESSFRDQHSAKPAEYSPFSPESLDATQFSHGNDRLSPESRRLAANSSTSVIMGPSEDLGLHCYQAITTRSEDLEQVDPAPVVIEVPDIPDVVPDPPDIPDAHNVPVVPVVPVAAEEQQEDQRGLHVNLEQWNQFLEAAYVNRNQFEEQLDASDDAPQQLRDSGIARPSFSGSVDILGSTFEDSGHRDVDNLSLVARLWNEELAAALAMESQLMDEELPEDYAAGVNDSEQSASSYATESPPKVPGAREETYYSYDKIDEDIRDGEAHPATRAVALVDAMEHRDIVAIDMPRHDLSTIREERESVSSTETGSTPNRLVGGAEGTTGAELLAQLQLKNRLKRHLELSTTSSDDSSDENGLSEDDDEEVLVVDLKGKRAILMEGQSPKLKAALAAEDYDSIFGVEPAPHVMLNVKEENDRESKPDPDEEKASVTGVDVASEETETPGEVKDSEEVVEPETPEEDVRSTESNFDEDEQNERDSEDYDDDRSDFEEEEEDDDDGEEDDDDDGEDEDGGDGVGASNFIWQASYPSKMSNTSLSMEVIEEECEDEDQEEDGVQLQVQVEDGGQFVPSTWRSDLTPTRPAIKSPENGALSPGKKTLSVSFTNLSRKRVYEYPSEAEEEEVAPSPTRRQWQAPPSRTTESAYANFADWEFAAGDGDVDRVENDSEDGSPPKEAILKPVNVSRPAPHPPIPNNILYRLSDIENDDDDENDENDSIKGPTTLSVSASIAVDGSEADDFFRGQWSSPFTLSEFQPNQFFPNWATSSTLDVKEATVAPSVGTTATIDAEAIVADATNGNGEVDDQLNGVSVVGTLRHTRDSLRLDLPRSESEA